jgi:hypothetical protein
MQSLVTSLVLSRLDYCNSIGLVWASSLKHLSVSRRCGILLLGWSLTFFNIRRSEHVTDALVSLHWLRVAERIRF